MEPVLHKTGAGTMQRFLYVLLDLSIEYGDFECYILQYLQYRVTHLAAWRVARYMKLLGESTTTSGNHLLFFEDTNFVLSLNVTSIAARHLLGALCQ